MQNRVRELRERQGLTQEDLAKLAGTTQPQIARLEASERRLTDVWIERLSRALKCHPVDLFTDELPGLSEDERKILATYRGLGEARRSQMMKAIEAYTPEAVDEQVLAELVKLSRTTQLVTSDMDRTLLAKLDQFVETELAKHPEFATPNPRQRAAVIAPIYAILEGERLQGSENTDLARFALFIASKAAEFRAQSSRRPQA